MTKRQHYLLLSVALFGFIVPNGLFFYYLFAEFSSLTEVIHNHLALGFIIDAFMAMGLLSWWFARNPIGLYSWKWFVALSLLGGLGFSLPMYYFLNKQR